MDYRKMTLKSLRKVARDLGVQRVNTFSKEALVEHLSAKPLGGAALKAADVEAGAPAPAETRPAKPKLRVVTSKKSAPKERPSLQAIVAQTFSKVGDSADITKLCEQFGLKRSSLSTVMADFGNPNTGMGKKFGWKITRDGDRATRTA